MVLHYSVQTWLWRSDRQTLHVKYWYRTAPLTLEADHNVVEKWVDDEVACKLKNRDLMIVCQLAGEDRIIKHIGANLALEQHVKWH